VNRFDTITFSHAAGGGLNTISRRQLFRVLGGLGVAAVAAGVTGKANLANAQQAAATQYKTTTALNFRAGPGTTYPIIDVIPAGGIVAHTGAIQNGFYEVGYGGTYGWAHGDYLVPVGGGDPAIVGEARTTDDVNLRSGPSTGHRVLRVVAAGTWVRISDTIENCSLYVVHDGLAGWMYDDYLDWPTDDRGGNYKTTTDALNLRAEPSTKAKVLTVMAKGSRVQMLHTAANGFANVNYNGLQGWAHLDYLR